MDCCVSLRREWVEEAYAVACLMTGKTTPTGNAILKRVHSGFIETNMPMATPGALNDGATVKA